MTAYEIEVLKTGGRPRSPQWPRVRRAHLAAHPSCRACGGRDHVEAHHKLPFHLHPELELDPANLVTLCEAPGHYCHFRVGHGYNWLRFNGAVEVDADHDLARVTAITKGG